MNMLDTIVSQSPRDYMQRDNPLHTTSYTTSMMDADDLEEDPAFLAEGSLPSLKLSNASKHHVVDTAAESYAMQSLTRQPSLIESTTCSTPALTAADTDELEEDLDFIAPHAEDAQPVGQDEGTRLDAQGSDSASQIHDDARRSPPLPSTDAEADDDLPSATQLIRDTLRHGRLDVSNLDLGLRLNAVRSISGTTFDGKRVSFKRQRGNAFVGESSHALSNDTEALGKLALSLLKTPMHQMMARIEEKRFEAAKSAAEQAEQVAKSAKVDVRGKGKHVPDIWTDRYRPKSFTDLLGDERTHRQAMSWLKEWDTCVFRKAGAAKKKILKRSLATHQGAESEKEPLDPLRRPLDKVLMLTGPPGLGKTTLAHVIATQAGYQIMEINASDDRSAKTVEDKIRNSLESRALTSLGSLSSCKPTCLIIDEIDGATGGGDSGFIRTLVKLIVEGSKVTQVKKQGKGKKDAQPLLRPIICICNDLYAPALRPLRQMARVVRFHPPTTAHLSKRLRDICDRESLKADSKSLTTLIEVSGGDIRSCLNTLQVVRKQSDTLEVEAIKSAALGSKDTSASVSAIWDKLFKMPAKKRPKNTLSVNADTGRAEDAADGRYVSSLSREISTCGEYDKLAQTCFENYLKVKSPPDGFRAFAKGLEWLDFYDRLDSRIRSERECDVMPYIPYAFVAWNPLFAAVSNKTPEWPKVDYEMYVKRTAHQEIADTLRKSLPLNLKALFTGPSITAELAPLLLRIISPDLKPVNQQLIRSEDRLALKRLIRTMLDLQMSYQQDRNEDGQIVFKLEPQLDVFIHYEGKRASDMPAARYNLRQLVARELEAENLRRTGGDNENAAGTRTGKTASEIHNAYKKGAEPDEGVKAGKDGPALDFFGRPVIQKKQTQEDGIIAAASLAAPAMKRPRITYKYHEGFSNAVRNNIKVHELFR